MLRGTAIYDIIRIFPFMLSLSKHSESFFSNLLDNISRTVG